MRAKFINEGLADVLKPKPLKQVLKHYKVITDSEIDKYLKRHGKIVEISPEVSEYFVVVEILHGGEYIYYFIENALRPFVRSTSPTKYIYTLKKGNVYREHRDNYAKQELRSDSSAYNKGDPNKMAHPNDLEG